MVRLEPKGLVRILMLAAVLYMVGCGVNTPHGSGSPVASATIRDKAGNNATQFTISVSPAEFDGCGGKVRVSQDYNDDCTGVQPPASQSRCIPSKYERRVPAFERENYVSSTATPAICSIGTCRRSGRLATAFRRASRTPTGHDARDGELRLEPCDFRALPLLS